MLKQVNLVTDKDNWKSISRGFAIGAAALAFSVATPAAAGSSGVSIEFEDFSFNSDSDDFLEKLIALDADDIDDLRRELSEARSEIAEAITEIDDARAEVKGIPGGRFILKIAFGAATSAITQAVDEAFGEVRTGLDGAERELAATADEVGPAEVAETQKAIEVIRTGLADIEAALKELTDAMKT